MGRDLGAFMCVHGRDVDYLFPQALASLVRHVPGLDAVHVVSNDPAAVRGAAAGLDLPVPVVVSDDADWLSPRELELPGWYRQQLVKLRSHRVVGRRWVVVLGADTVLLEDVPTSDLVVDDQQVLWWTRHRLPDVHWLYERKRVRAVGRLCGVRPRRALRRADWISDLFTFDAEVLDALQAHLEERWGPDPWATVLAGRSTSARDQRDFGEWTLYATFVLDVLGRSPVLRDASRGRLEQVHSARALRRSRFDAGVVHVVPKGLDLAEITARVDAARARRAGRSAVAPAGDTVSDSE